MKRVLALGFFDGVHLGHTALIRRTAERARELGAAPAVLTFDVHPDTLVQKTPVPLITSPADRAELVRRLGVEEILSLRFDETLMQMPWDRFVEWVQTEFSAVHLVCGHDFTFGWKGQGKPDLLKARAAELGMGCDVIAKVDADGETVSSTRIRRAVQNGDLTLAKSLLGRPYVITGVVQQGDKRGRLLGFPTANLDVKNLVVPPLGVYKAKVGQFCAMANLGCNPTFGVTEPRLEVHLFDFNGNLYGQTISVELGAKLRDQKQFANVEELKAQLAQDKINACLS